MEALVLIYHVEKIKKCEILFKSVLFFEPFYEKGQYLLSRPSKGAHH